MNTYLVTLTNGKTQTVRADKMAVQGNTLALVVNNIHVAVFVGNWASCVIVDPTQPTTTPAPASPVTTTPPSK